MGSFDAGTWFAVGFEAYGAYGARKRCAVVKNTLAQTDSDTCTPVHTHAQEQQPYTILLRAHIHMQPGLCTPTPTYVLRPFRQLPRATLRHARARRSSPHVCVGVPAGITLAIIIIITVTQSRHIRGHVQMTISAWPGRRALFGWPVRASLQSDWGALPGAANLTTAGRWPR